MCQHVCLPLHLDRGSACLHTSELLDTDERPHCQLEKDEETQVNTLLYSMGDEADDILRSFRLSAEDAKKYEMVKGKFDEHFIKRQNVIYEHTKFNQRRQEPGESVDSFITALYGLAEYRGYSDLNDKMIHDRIVVDLHDARLSEKLQLDPDLTLEKAIT